MKTEKGVNIFIKHQDSFNAIIIAISITQPFFLMLSATFQSQTQIVPPLGSLPGVTHKEVFSSFHALITGCSQTCSESITMFYWNLLIMLLFFIDH